MLVLLVLNTGKAVDYDGEKHKVRGLLPNKSQKNYDTNP
jgi:hypothetical protein